MERDEKGRFVSAKPVLHRQVEAHAYNCDCNLCWLGVADSLPKPHGPRIEVAVVWAIVAAVAAGLAFVAHMLGAI